MHRVIDYGGKVPKFSAESLWLCQGMATSGRWCHNGHYNTHESIGLWSHKAQLSVLLLVYRPTMGWVCPRGTFTMFNYSFIHGRGNIIPLFAFNPFIHPLFSLL